MYVCEAPFSLRHNKCKLIAMIVMLLLLLPTGDPPACDAKHYQRHLGHPAAAGPSTNHHQNLLFFLWQMSLLCGTYKVYVHDVVSKHQYQYLYQFWPVVPVGLLTLLVSRCRFCRFRRFRMGSLLLLSGARRRRRRCPRTWRSFVPKSQTAPCSSSWNRCVGRSDPRKVHTYVSRCEHSSAGRIPNWEAYLCALSFPVLSGCFAARAYISTRILLAYMYVPHSSRWHGL